MPFYDDPVVRTVWFAVCLVLVVLVVVAWCLWIALMVDIAKEKGCPWGRGWLWFIGLALTPVALGLAVIAMPDRRS